jgi:hypothetical protein
MIHPYRVEQTLGDMLCRDAFNPAIQPKERFAMCIGLLWLLYNNETTPIHPRPAFVIRQAALHGFMRGVGYRTSTPTFQRELGETLYTGEITFLQLGSIVADLVDKRYTKEEIYMSVMPALLLMSIDHHVAAKRYNPLYLTCLSMLNIYRHGNLRSDYLSKGVDFGDFHTHDHMVHMANRMDSLLHPSVKLDTWKLRTLRDLGAITQMGFMLEMNRWMHDVAKTGEDHGLLQMDPTDIAVWCIQCADHITHAATPQPTKYLIQERHHAKKVHRGQV